MKLHEPDITLSNYTTFLSPVKPHTHITDHYL